MLLRNGGGFIKLQLCKNTAYILFPNETDTIPQGSLVISVDYDGGITLPDIKFTPADLNKIARTINRQSRKLLVEDDCKNIRD
jgi:hypothetical protein